MRRMVVLVLVLVILFATACGKSSKKEAGTEQPAGQPPVQLPGQVNNHGTKAVSGDKLEIELDDFYFGPTFVTGSGSRTVSITLHNEGKARHTFTSSQLHVDEELEPGATKQVQVSLPSGGTVRFSCRFHESRGMQGAFSL